MTTARLRVCLLGAAFACGCATGAPPAASPPAITAPPAAERPITPPPTRTRAEVLADTLDAILAAPAFERASVGVAVRSLDTGATLFRRHGQTWLVPASTMKVLTAVAAAERLGWGFRFETRLVATGPIVDGVLDGDLMVVGTGDPTINPRHPARADAFDRWADALRARGIRRINGHVIGDDHAVAAPGLGIGWAWDDLLEDYGAAYGALQYRDSVVEVTMGPGVTPGAPAVVYLSPANHGLLVDVQAVTSAEGTTPSLVLRRPLGTRFLEVDGQAPLGSTAMTRPVAVANPTVYFASELKATLQRRGIVVDGRGMDIDEESDPPRAADGTLLLVDQSAPLAEIARQMLEWSLNNYAESLLVALDQTPPATDADGLAALRETLSDLGVPPGSYSTRDGSGLSRNDYLSADALVAVLAGAWNRPSLRGTLKGALPVAGGDGTLGRRLRGTPGEGRVFAKTGSMSNVRSLAGYVDTAAGEPLAFAIITNGFDVPAREIDARVDELLLALVALPRE
ncbi:MAG: D-alanyl-D-alanine carboxypeptidase/D-alanyl-D-alanine-endopeptidase [Vicinamibacterales bacterium]